MKYNAKLVRHILLSLVFIFSSALVGDDAYAASKKKKKNGNKGVLLQNVDVETFIVEATLKSKSNSKKKKKKKSKSKTVQIRCLDKAPGIVKSTKRGTEFFSYAKLIKKTKNKKKKASLKQLKRAGSAACKNPGFQSLDPYRGPFGAAEARSLCDRFAFGCNPDQVARMVTIGLQASAVEFTTYRPEPTLDQHVADIECDQYPVTDQRNEACDPRDLNDLDRTGLRYGVYARFLYSQNPALYRLMFFLHDERQAASTNAVDGNEYHAARSHVQMLRAGALTGNYKAYMTNWLNDHLGHLRWLDGASNSGLLNPNENQAREFWELGTIGPKNLDGTPVYGPLDVAQAALTLSGWTISREEGRRTNGDTYSIDVGSWSPVLHRAGPKTVFIGTPYQTTVYDQDDLVEATFNHPRAAEHLAEDLWHEYVCPTASATAIRQLAAVIRKNNFNLHPVLRTLMTSRAIFSEQCSKALIKHPVDKLFGFLRATRFPVASYRYERIDDYLEWMNERPLLPDTVFGWNTELLAGELFVIGNRNAFENILDRGDSLEEDDNYNPRYVFFRGLPARPTTRDLASHVATMLNVQLNNNQLNALTNFLDYDRDPECSNWEANEYGCTQGLPWLRRAQYDFALDADPSMRDKLLGLILAIVQLPQYSMK